MSAGKKCDGCNHNYYSAPGGQQGYPGCDPIYTEPHTRCLYFKAYIPMLIEKKKGCDGTMSAEWVRSEIPPGCPTFSQGALL